MQIPELRHAHSPAPVRGEGGRPSSGSSEFGPVGHEDLLALVELMPAPAFMADAAGRNIFSNQAFQDFTGLPAGELAGAGWIDTLHPEDRGRVVSVWSEAVAGTTPYEARFRMRGANGDWRWFLVRGRPQRNQEGAVIRWLGVATDIDDLLRAQAGQRQSDERLQLAAQIAGFGVFEWHPGDGRCEASRELYRIYGLPADGKLTLEERAARWHPEDRARKMAALAQLADPDGPRELVYEYRILRPDGQVRWLKALGRALGAGSGSSRRVTRVVCAVQDVTELRETAEELARINAGLEQQVATRTAQLVQSQKMEAIGQLTSGIAHDFNNMLQGIGSCLDMLERRLADARERRLLSIAQASVARGADLVRQMLTFARRQVMTPRPTDVGRLVENLLPMIERSLGAKARVEWRPPQMPCWSLVDPGQLENAIVNLAINARDAMADGGTVRIGLQAERIGSDVPAGMVPADLAPGDYLRITVADTGTGMDPDVLDHCLEPFFTTKEVGKGTGLGLAMVYGMAVQSGGGLRIESAKGEGTAVAIYLRRSARQAEDAPGEENPNN